MKDGIVWKYKGLQVKQHHYPDKTVTYLYTKKRGKAVYLDNLEDAAKYMVQNVGRKYKEWLETRKEEEYDEQIS